MDAASGLLLKFQSAQVGQERMRRPQAGYPLNLDEMVVVRGPSVKKNIDPSDIFTGRISRGEGTFCIRLNTQGSSEMANHPLALAPQRQLFLCSLFYDRQVL